jgi:hypothetical protein
MDEKIEKEVRGRGRATRPSVSVEGEQKYLKSQVKGKAS